MGVKSPEIRFASGPICYSRQYFFSEGLFVVAVVLPAGFGQFSVVPGPGAVSGFGISASSRIVWVLVQADIENTGVAFEAVLRPFP
ncbi:MAG: hypothetical protein Ct9H300mP14_09730 [Gammaproteobacteria bacterium]|nr:MAG: hypothetical protein Ct9H300mP14_09730 [Gammaproteobacteria bacterium]